jgi:hypothetical protein
MDIMKKKTIIILAGVILVIVACCCAILAGLVIWNYSNTESSEIPFSSEFIQQMNATPTPYIIIQITGEAEQPDELPQTFDNGNYAKEVGQKLVTCSEKIGNFSTIAIQLNENVNLIFDTDYINEVNDSVDEIEISCTNIGQDEGVPAQYTDVNDELQMADEDMKSFVDNIHNGLDSFDVEAITQALYDLASASSHYENAGEYLK